MRRGCGLLVIGIAFLVAGCSEAKKLESICVDIVESVLVDPSSLNINSVRVSEGKLRVSAIERHFDSRYPDGLSAIAREMLEVRKKDASDSTNIFIAVDYTAKARLGTIRDEALCRYFKWPDGDTELVSFTIRNRDYQQRELFDIFVRYGRPDGISPLYMVR